MYVSMFIHSNNAAFEDPGEVPRILRKLADTIEASGEPPKHLQIRDVNGNLVGLFDSSQTGEDNGWF